MEKIHKITYGPNVPVSVSGRRIRKVYDDLVDYEIEFERKMLEIWEASTKALMKDKEPKVGNIICFGTGGNESWIKNKWFENNPPENERREETK